jgi:hypothetical protein
MDPNFGFPQRNAKLFSKKFLPRTKKHFSEQREIFVFLWGTFFIKFSLKWVRKWLRYSVLGEN